MRLTDVPSYGIGIFKKDGSLVFVRPTLEGSFYNGECYYTNSDGDVTQANGITVGKKIPCLEGCYRERDELLRFWSLPPEEVEPLEKLIREKLGV